MRQLRQFVAVARTGSFIAAADKLYISRPAVSKTVSKLEEELGLRLFERRPDGAVLTADGEALLPHAERAIEAFEVLEVSVHSLAGARGTVRLGFTYGVRTAMMDALAAFSRRHPDIRLEPVECSFDDLPRLLRSGALDAGFSGVRYEMPGGFNAEDIYRCELYWGVQADSEIAARGYITEAEIAANVHFVPRGGRDVKSDMETIVTEPSPGVFVPDDSPRQYVFDDNMFYLLRLVEQGRGIMSIARDAIPESVGGVAFLPCREKMRYWQVRAYYPARGSRAARLFLRELKNELEVEK